MSVAITSHTFFRGDLDRCRSTEFVEQTKKPVLRRSSVPERYVLTFFCPQRKTVVHSLIVADNTDRILNVAESGFVYGRYRDLDEFLSKALDHDPSA